MTSVTATLTIAYDIRAVRKRTLSSIEDLRAFTGINPDVMDDGRVSALLDLANRRIRAMTGRSNINGIANKELLGRSDGFSRNYFLMFKPVLHTLVEQGGETTKNPADVKVYTLNPVNDDTFTVVDPSTYLFNGDSGHLVFKKDSIPKGGLDIYVSYFYDTELLKQAEMCLAASWAFGQMVPTENRDNRPTRYKMEFDEIMQRYVGEDHYFTATDSAEDKDNIYREGMTHGQAHQTYYAEKY